LVRREKRGVTESRREGHLSPTIHVRKEEDAARSNLQVSGEKYSLDGLECFLNNVSNSRKGERTLDDLRRHQTRSSITATQPKGYDFTTRGMKGEKGEEGGLLREGACRTLKILGKKKRDRLIS